jgi:hypothetical protein
VTVPLPPLPHTGDDESYRPGGRSLIDLLAEEHDRIIGLVAELADPAVEPERRERVAEVVAATVSRHLSAEEQYLYPTVRAALSDGAALAERAIDADRALRDAVGELTRTSPADARFAELVDAVGTQVRRHGGAAGDVFPALRRVVAERDLIRLGNRAEIAEEAAPTRPHHGMPDHPPWNRIVDPAVGVVDKVRDAVTGRETYPEDLDRHPKVE